MKPAEAKAISELIKDLRANGVKEMSFDGFKVTFDSGDADQILAQGSDLPPPPSLEEIKETQKITEDTEYALNAEDALAQLQIDDPEAFEDAFIQRELGTSGEPEDENDISFD